MFPRAPQQQLDYERQLLTLELAKVKAKVQLEDIEGALGNVEVRAHETKSTTSGTCAVCNSGFNVLSKGLQCTVCDMRYHPSKCVLKVPPCGHQVMAQPPSATPIAAGTITQEGKENNGREQWWVWTGMLTDFEDACGNCRAPEPRTCQGRRDRHPAVHQDHFAATAKQHRRHRRARCCRSQR